MVANLYLLRIVAILLIVNSHLSHFYPISSLSFGGHLGNSIFYLISGYGLSISYQKVPLPLLLWIKKRLIGALLPLTGILLVLNIGDFMGFQNDIMNHLVWHKVEQLEYFLPVLWVLYVLFRPFNLFKQKHAILFLMFLGILSAVLFYIKINSGEPYKTGLPSEGIFFFLNALGCFVIGIQIAKADLERLIQSLSFTVFKMFLVIVVLQIFHKAIIIYVPSVVWINFYLNFICVITIFLFVMSIHTKFSEGVVDVLKGLATSSLAIYLVHFKFIVIAEYLQMQFPYSVIFIVIHSFLWAYAITYFVDLLVKKLFKLQLQQFESVLKHR